MATNWGNLQNSERATLRSRKEAAGAAAEDALAQLSGMSGFMRDAPAAIHEAVFNRRQPGLQSLLDRKQTVRQNIYPAVFETMANVPRGLGGMSPEAALAAGMRAAGRHESEYANISDLARAYGTDTDSLVGRAMQGLQMQYQALNDQFRNQQSVEQNLADRIFRGRQLNEQIAGNEWQRDFEERKFQEDIRRFGLQFALANRGGGGGGGGGGRGNGYDGSSPIGDNPNLVQLGNMVYDMDNPEDVAAYNRLYPLSQRAVSASMAAQKAGEEVANSPFYNPETGRIKTGLGLYLTNLGQKLFGGDRPTPRPGFASRGRAMSNYFNRT